jgi:hypothetical protein
MRGGAGVEVFHHEDGDYALWRTAHPDGYVVNVRADGPLLLHRATCRNLRPTGAAKGKSSTNLPKACGTNRADLEAWARREGRSLVLCANCGA